MEQLLIGQVEYIDNENINFKKANPWADWLNYHGIERHDMDR